MLPACHPRIIIFLPLCPPLLPPTSQAAGVKHHATADNQQEEPSSEPTTSRSPAAATPLPSKKPDLHRLDHRGEDDDSEDDGRGSLLSPPSPPEAEADGGADDDRGSRRVRVCVAILFLTQHLMLWLLKVARGKSVRAGKTGQVFGAVIYDIWMERNTEIFQGVATTTVELIGKVLRLCCVEGLVIEDDVV
ncbi:hypothetical protein Dimus_018728 [Dionaea muscipula]